MFELLDFNENPNVGIYCRTNEQIAFLQYTLLKSVKKRIQAALQVELIELSIADSTIIGSLLTMNSQGAVITWSANQQTIKAIKKQGLRLMVIEDILNAAGNDILVNDHGAMVHPKIKDETIQELHETLGVPVERGTIAEQDIVGMAAVVTNQGCLCHPKITPDEKNHLEQLFNVEAMIGTVNHGDPMIGTGLVANSKGAIIGRNTTGIEMGRIEEALGFLK
ncbi:MAG: translation initiation factor IF-6 [Candidatus Thermoplasmatota archaeon]|nr:translation initiation factor IF-6 [Candidatus Thermoplasmatota archaeon]MBU1941935.1 translation initiation factor IF-6 [Candidatus Thermoplasmatota archaeon]